MSDFERAFQLVVHNEGEGYDRKDPGGVTRFGISQKAYPRLNIAALTINQVKAIYFKDYWLKACCDVLEWPLSLFVFDAAVNQGLSAAITLLQKALNVEADGVLGRQTMTAIHEADLRLVCAKFMTNRAFRYVNTRGFDRYGRGWFNRIFDVAIQS